MKNLFRGILSLLAVALVLTSCNKEETATSPNDGELTYVFNPMNLSASLGATAAESGQVVPLLSNGSLTWTSGTFNIKKVKLSAKKNGADFNVEYNDMFNMNVLTMTNAGKVVLPEGTYSAPELTVSLVQSATNVPVSIKGVYTEASGTKIPVEFQFNYTYEMKGKIEDITIKGDKYKATIQLALNNLVNGLSASDFGHATRTGSDNAIVISMESNVTLFIKMIQNLPATVAMDIQHQ